MKQVYPKGWTLADEMQWEQQINKIVSEPFGPMRSLLLAELASPEKGRALMIDALKNAWLARISIPPPTWWQSMKWKFRSAE